MLKAANTTLITEDTVKIVFPKYGAKILIAIISIISTQAPVVKTAAGITDFFRKLSMKKFYHRFLALTNLIFLDIMAIISGCSVTASTSRLGRFSLGSNPSTPTLKDKVFTALVVSYFALICIRASVDKQY